MRIARSACRPLASVVSPPMPPATNTPTKHSAAPERSLTQRMDALQRANEIRTRRAQLKRDLKGGRMSIHQLLLDPPEYLETAKVFDMLLAVPKYGRVKVNKILQQCRISPSKTIGGLSERQRTELVAAAPLAAPRGRMPGLRHHRPLRGRQGHADPPPARARARARAVACRPPPAGRGRASQGVDYWFLTDAEFGERVEAGDFVEHAEYSGRRYGTLRSELDRRLAAAVRSCSRSSCRAPARSARRCPRRCRSSSRRRRRRRCATRLDRPRHRRRRAGRAPPATSPSEELAAKDEFAHVVVNDRLEDAVERAGWRSCGGYTGAR